MEKVYNDNYYYITDYCNYFRGSGNIECMMFDVSKRLSEPLKKSLRCVIYKPTRISEVYSYNPCMATCDQKDYILL